MHEMGLTDSNIERRKKIVGLEAADVARIGGLRDLVASRLDELGEAFFAHLATLEEARPLMSSRAVLARARQLKKEHLVALVAGNYGPRTSNNGWNWRSSIPRSGSMHGSFWAPSNSCSRALAPPRFSRQI